MQIYLGKWSDLKAGTCQEILFGFAVWKSFAQFRGTVQLSAQKADKIDFSGQ